MNWLRKKQFYKINLKKINDFNKFNILRLHKPQGTNWLAVVASSNLSQEVAKAVW